MDQEVDNLLYTLGLVDENTNETSQQTVNGRRHAVEITDELIIPDFSPYDQVDIDQIAPTIFTVKELRGPPSLCDDVIAQVPEMSISGVQMYETLYL